MYHHPGDYCWSPSSCSNRAVDTFEITEIFLKFVLLEKVDLSLMMLQSTSMSISDGRLAICKGWELRPEVEKYIFTNSLMGTTIQDDGKREKSRTYML